MNHKSIIKVLAGLFCFSILNSFIQLFVVFPFNPAILYIFLFSFITIYLIFHFRAKVRPNNNIKRNKKSLNRKALYFRLSNANKKRLLLGINVFLLFRHLDF